jgi:hypothetical protein
MHSLTYLYMLLVFDGFNETDYALFNIAMSLLSFVCLMVVMPLCSGKFQVLISWKDFDTGKGAHISRSVLEIEEKR